MFSPRTRALVGLALLVAGTAGLALLGDLRAHTLGYPILYAVGAAGYLLVCWGRRSLSLPLVVVVAVVLRILLLPGTPTLSDDFYRYLWDGRVQQAGINPYRYPPDDPALDRVHYADRTLINHPGTRTIYPPLAELLFAGMTRVGLGGLWGLKLVFGAFDVLTAVLIALAAGRARRVSALALYLLHPLIVQETWSSAHLEITVVACVMAALVLLVRGRDVAAGVALGLGTAFKLTPAFLLVPALLGRRARPLPLLAGFIPAVVLPYLPYLLTGGALGSAGDTQATPRFNASVFSLLQLVFPYAWARVAAAVLFFAGAAALSLWLPGRDRAPAAFAATATLVLLVLPVVLPWYWMTPLALSAAAGLFTPLILGLAAPAVYASHLRAPFGGRAWARVVSYVPAIFAVPRDTRLLRKERKPTAPKAST